MKRGHSRVKSTAVALIALFLVAALATAAMEQESIDLSDERVENSSQYNMSLQNKVITGPKGSLTSPQATSANERAQVAYPQGVYNGQEVERATLDNGGKVNKSFLEKMALTTAVRHLGLQLTLRASRPN